MYNVIFQTQDECLIEQSVKLKQKTNFSKIEQGKNRHSMANMNPKKPPQEYQWKTGQSGNPKGRKKGVADIRTIRSIYQKLLNQEIEAIDPLTKEMVTSTVYEHIIARQVAEALAGNDKAVDRIMDRLEGKAVQSTTSSIDMKMTTQDEFIIQLAKKAELSSKADSW